MNTAAPPRRWEPAAFAALVALSLVPVWATTYFPTQDGPAHVENAAILLRLAGGDGGELGPYVTLQWRPNVLGHALMAALMTIASPLLAEKLLLSLCVVSLPLAMRYAAGAINPASRWIGYLALPLIFSRLLHSGFYNFALGLALVLVLLGYWIKHRDGPAPRRAVGIGLLAVLTCLAHLFAALAGLMALVLLQSVFPCGRRPRALLASLAALIPAIALCAHGLLQSGGVDATPMTSRAQQLLRLVTLDVLVSLHPRVIFIAAAVAQVIGLLVVWALARKVIRREFNRWDVLLGVAAALAGAHLWAISRGAAFLFIPDRLAILCPLMLLLWLAAQSFPRALRVGAPILAAIAALGIMGLNLVRQIPISRQIEACVTAGDQLDAGRTMLALSFAPQGLDESGEPLAARVSPFLHAEGHIAATRRLINIGNYEAISGHFPVRFRQQVDPKKHAALRERGAHGPPFVDLERYESQTGVRIDYILLQGLRDEDLHHATTRTLMAHLSRCYVEMPPSSDAGVRVFRRMAQRR